MCLQYKSFENTMGEGEIVFYSWFNDQMDDHLKTLSAKRVNAGY